MADWINPWPLTPKKYTHCFCCSFPFVILHITKHGNKASIVLIFTCQIAGISFAVFNKQLTVHRWVNFICWWITMESCSQIIKLNPNMWQIFFLWWLSFKVIIYHRKKEYTLWPYAYRVKLKMVWVMIFIQCSLFSVKC